MKLIENDFCELKSILTKDLKTSKIAYKCFVFSNLFLSLNEAFDLVLRLILKIL